MTERPIIFSAPMVRAILAGTKTQTRRVVKGAPHDWAPVQPQVYSPTVIDRRGNEQPGPAAYGAGNADGECWIRCPYGQPGTTLWVREAWADEHPLAIQDGRYSQPGRAGIPGPPPVSFRTIYRADGEPLQVWRNGDQSYPYWTRSGPASEIDADFPTVCSNYQRGGKAIYWGPSIQMPRWASRITLEITSVRVERLQDISEADAAAEGVTAKWEPGCSGRLMEALGGFSFRPAASAYADLWESLHGPGSWDANPWVWVVEFKRINQPGNT